MIIRRVALALVVVLVALAVPAPPAYAGGPTSVLLANPGRAQVAAAYYSASSYAALTAAVGEGRTGPSAPPPGHAEGEGEEVRLTWLIHDIQVWRVDRIHFTGAGVWVETVVDINDSGDVFDRPAVWHQPADEAALVTVLTEAGVLDDGSPATAGPPPARAEAAAPDPATAGPGLVVAAVVGLVVGAAGAMVGVRARARSRAAQPPRVTLTG